MGKPAEGATTADQVERYGIANIGRHILFCAGPDCIDAAHGEMAWNYLKRRILELKLDRAPTSVYRTRCACLRVCMKGPIAVVYPEGVWYELADEGVIERILQEHVLGGRVVEEYVIARRALGE